jgi:O-methyltransferase involved in polyketide biosynthesis
MIRSRQCSTIGENRQVVIVGAGHHNRSWRMPRPGVRSADLLTGEAERR